MTNFLNKSLTLFIISITFICSAKEEVLFTVNNNPNTTIDLNQRLFYLSVLDNFDINNINKDNYINDLISVKLFDEFAKTNKIDVNEEEINNYFDIIFTKNKIKIENLYNKKELTKELILKNIQYDLQRKTIIEYFLEEKINKIDLLNNKYDIIDIYKINIYYFIFSKENKAETEIVYEQLLKENINTIKKSLDNSGIKYEFFSRKIISLDPINNKIKNMILNNKKVFIIEENSYLMTGKIIKQLKKDIDLKYSFVQIIPKQNINIDLIEDDQINCKNIKNKKIDNRVEIKEYKNVNLEDLNMDIFQYLTKTNERLLIKNNNQKSIILLCEIDYNEKMAKNKIFENRIQKIAKEIEIEFIQTKKKEFNFQSFY